MLTPLNTLSLRPLTRLALAVLLVLPVASVLTQNPLVHAAESATAIPAPAVDATTPGDEIATAVVAGGCFWGVQAVFAHVKGVTLARAGEEGVLTPAATAERHRL